MKLVKTNGRNDDFLSLVKLLDQDLHERYGDLQKEYTPHNQLDDIHDVVLIYKDGVAAACGAFKEFDSSTIELKRIFVEKAFRGQGLSKEIVRHLEQTGAEKGYAAAVLETGTKQHEAINLYKRAGYSAIPNYGPYIGKSASLCMKKSLISEED